MRWIISKRAFQILCDASSGCNWAVLFWSQLCTSWGSAQKFLVYHAFPKFIQVIQRESNDSGCKKIQEKKISKVKSYLLWKFVEKGWILFCNVGRLWFSSGSNYSEERGILYERKRENTHNSQGVLTVCAIILISDISGQWERIKMKFIFDRHEFLRQKSQLVSQGATWSHVCPSVSGQAGGRPLDALPGFGVSFKITSSAKNPCAAFPEGIGLASACSHPSWGGAEDASVGQSQVGAALTPGQGDPNSIFHCRGTQLPNFCSRVVWARWMYPCPRLSLQSPLVTQFNHCPPCWSWSFQCRQA